MLAHSSFCSIFASGTLKEAYSTRAPLIDVYCRRQVSLLVPDLLYTRLNPPNGWTMDRDY